MVTVRAGRGNGELLFDWGRSFSLGDENSSGDGW